MANGDLRHVPDPSPGDPAWREMDSYFHDEEQPSSDTCVRNHLAEIKRIIDCLYRLLESVHNPLPCDLLQSTTCIGLEVLATDKPRDTDFIRDKFSKLSDEIRERLEEISVRRSHYLRHTAERLSRLQETSKPGDPGYFPTPSFSHTDQQSPRSKSEFMTPEPIATNMGLCH